MEKVERVFKELQKKREISKKIKIILDNKKTKSFESKCPYEIYYNNKMNNLSNEEIIFSFFHEEYHLTKIFSPARSILYILILIVLILYQPIIKLEYGVIYFLGFVVICFVVWYKCFKRIDEFKADEFSCKKINKLYPKIECWNLLNNLFKVLKDENKNIIKRLLNYHPPLKKRLNYLIKKLKWNS